MSKLCSWLKCSAITLGLISSLVVAPVVLAADATKPATAVPATVAAPIAAQIQSAKQQPTKVLNGAFLTSLYDMNTNNNTFRADLWLWFRHDKAQELKPLKSRELANARDFKTSLENSKDVGGERYHAEKIQGTFNYGWDVRNFPFDRHELQIRVEESQQEIDKLVYLADTTNTAIDPSINIEGWRIDKIKVAADTRLYASSFGEGDSAKSEYGTNVISLFIERDAMGLFWKLLAAVYIAFLISTLSYFMDPSKDGIFNGRIGLLVGMTFAVIINSQRVASTLGQSTAFTLADKIHILTLGMILVALTASLISRHRHLTNRGAEATRDDRRIAISMIAIYVLANVVMIALAATAS